VTLPTLATGDRAWLARALVLAVGARGRTSPNPNVGCVLVRDGEVVGEGATTPVGGPHAEAVALAAAGPSATGATAYVTLEPCAHHGRTPPCATALRDAGVARVVIGHPDPNPDARGGATVLSDAGVDVVALAADDALRAAVAAELEGFLSVVGRGRPHVTLKLAQTVAGHLHAEGRWVTGPAARRAVHRWRATADAVLVGSGTAVTDDPGLDVRDVPLGDRPQPRPVVLDGRLRTPPHARVVARGALVVTVAATLASPDGAERAAGLRRAGAEVVAVEGPDRPAPAAALRALADHGICRLFAEPGTTLAGALLAADVVDRLVLHVAADPRDPHTPFAAAVPTVAGTFGTARLGGAGPDVVWERIRTDRASDADATVIHPTTEVA
jgi:diaminohydroxyphosphoribosylaminopyrimidine deaminase/5-amino-6-(5-phosphoribosylamino)uracil reductase